MTGQVVDPHFLVEIVFKLQNQPNRSRAFVVDTGFTGDLTLPPDQVAAWQLPFDFMHRVSLADGSEVQLPVLKATIVWQGSLRNVQVFSTGERPLLGTGLLRDCELLVQFAEYGLVVVDPL